MLVAAFAVILVTVLLQGTTLGAVIRFLGLVEEQERQARLNASQAEAAMMEAQKKAVEVRAYDGEGRRNSIRSFSAVHAPRNDGRALRRPRGRA